MTQEQTYKLKEFNFHKSAWENKKATYEKYNHNDPDTLKDILHNIKFYEDEINNFTKLNK